MPRPAPALEPALAARLASLGQRLRARRKELGISAIAAAESAGMSRVTLHRIERGEASVTMGAWVSALAALGLDLDFTGDPKPKKPALPRTIRLNDYGQLKRLAWQVHGATRVTPQQALELYERNWKLVDQAAMDDRERALVTLLSNELSGGRLLVRA